MREVADTQEVIKTKWFKKDEVLGMIARNEIVDGLSLTVHPGGGGTRQTANPPWVGLRLAASGVSQKLMFTAA